MKLLISAALFLIVISCTTVKKTFIKAEKPLLSTTNSNYIPIGTVRIEKLYFDPFATESNFNEKSDFILNKQAADILYDMGGDIFWITNFDIKTHTLSSVGLCTKLIFDLVVIEQSK